MPGHVVVRMFGPLELQFPGGCVGVRDLGGVKPKQLLRCCCSGTQGPTG